MTVTPPAGWPPEVYAWLAVMRRYGLPCIPIGNLPT